MTTWIAWISLAVGVAAIVLVALSFRRRGDSPIDLPETPTFRNELRKEFHARLFGYLVLALLAVLSIISASILLKEPSCMDCDSDRLTAEAQKPPAPVPAASAAAPPMTREPTAPTAPDPVRERDEIARERARESRIRTDSEARAWARTFLTTVAGAIIGFLFGTAGMAPGAGRNGAAALPAPLPPPPVEGEQHGPALR